MQRFGALSWSIARRRTFKFAFAAKRDQITRRRTFQFAFTAKHYQIDDVDSENNVAPGWFPAAKYKDSTLKICAKTEKIVDQKQKLKRHPVNIRFF